MPIFQISLVVEKDRWVLPLLILLLINIMISTLFIISALLTYLFTYILSTTSNLDGVISYFSKIF